MGTTNFDALDIDSLTTDSINVSSYQIATDVDFIVGSASDQVGITIQLTDGAGNNIAAAAAVQIYLSSDAAGETIATDLPDSIDAATEGVLLAITSNLHYLGVTNSTGRIDTVVNHDGVNTLYVNVILPTGQRVTSTVLTFTAA